MKLTGLDVFDSTIQRTNVWLKELMYELNWSDSKKTYVGLRAVLHALRDRLPIPDAVRIGEELPMLMRGLYFEHWDPNGKPLSLHSRQEFLEVIAAALSEGDDDPAKAETVVRAVFRLLERKAADGEINDPSYILPPPLGDLWPPALRAA